MQRKPIMSIYLSRTAIRRALRKPIRPTQPQSCHVSPGVARESLTNFISAIEGRITENTTVNYLVDECSANVALIGDGFIVSLIYQEVKL